MAARSGIDVSGRLEQPGQASPDLGRAMVTTSAEALMWVRDNGPCPTACGC
jgi:hypothetical protein